MKYSNARFKGNSWKQLKNKFLTIAIDAVFICNATEEFMQKFLILV